jgi:hypothetical protein
MKKLCTLLVAVASFGIALSTSDPAAAIPLTWSLVNADFSGGGTATGSFVYDASTNTFSSIDITLSTTTSYGATTINQLVCTNCTTSGGTEAALELVNASTQADLFISFAGPLSPVLPSSGGTIAFDLGNSGEEQCVNTNCSPAAFVGPLVTFTSGELTTTPLPAALPLFATGLGGLGLLGWRRKRKLQAA